MTNQSSFKMIEDAWFTIRRNYDRLNQEANSDDREKLLSDRDGARDAYYIAKGKIYDELDGFTKNTRNQLDKILKQLKEELDQLKDIKAALDLVSSVALLAAALASAFIP